MKTTNDSVVQKVGGVELASDRGKFLTSREAAGYLGIGLRDLKGLRARQKLSFYRIGHRTVTYNTHDLDAFLKKCRNESVDVSKKSAA